MIEFVTEDKVSRVKVQPTLGGTCLTVQVTFAHDSGEGLAWLRPAECRRVAYALLHAAEEAVQ